MAVSVDLPFSAPSPRPSQGGVRVEQVEDKIRFCSETSFYLFLDQKKREPELENIETSSTCSTCSTCTEWSGGGALGLTVVILSCVRTSAACVSPRCRKFSGSLRALVQSPAAGRTEGQVARHHILDGWRSAQTALPRCHRRLKSIHQLGRFHPR